MNQTSSPAKGDAMNYDIVMYRGRRMILVQADLPRTLATRLQYELEYYKTTTAVYFATREHKPA